MPRFQIFALGFLGLLLVSAPVLALKGLASSASMTTIWIREPYALMHFAYDRSPRLCSLHRARPATEAELHSWDLVPRHNNGIVTTEQLADHIDRLVVTERFVVVHTIDFQFIAVDLDDPKAEPQTFATLEQAVAHLRRHGDPHRLHPTDFKPFEEYEQQDKARKQEPPPLLWFLLGLYLGGCTAVTLLAGLYSQHQRHEIESLVRRRKIAHTEEEGQTTGASET